MLNTCSAGNAVNMHCQRWANACKLVCNGEVQMQQYHPDHLLCCLTHITSPEHPALTVDQQRFTSTTLEQPTRPIPMQTCKHAAATHAQPAWLHATDSTKEHCAPLPRHSLKPHARLLRRCLPHQPRPLQTCTVFETLPTQPHSWQPAATRRNAQPHTSQSPRPHDLRQLMCYPSTAKHHNAARCLQAACWLPAGTSMPLLCPSGPGSSGSLQPGILTAGTSAPATRLQRSGLAGCSLQGWPRCSSSIGHQATCSLLRPSRPPRHSPA